ncbi:hypothetical protein ACLMJK_001490 [Lecanora helva]
MSRFMRCLFVFHSINIIFCLSIALPAGYVDSSPASPLVERQRSRRGIQVLPGKCDGAQLLAAENAILDASYLATAGLNAASNFERPPFSYFFQNNVSTANFVAGILQRVVLSQQGKGYPIDVTCEDKYQHCHPETTSYAVNFIERSENPSLIVLCPLALSRRRNPIPCTANPGALSLGWLMLHTMVTTHSVSPPPLAIIETPSDRARSVQDALRSGKDTTRMADAYAHLGSWSWDLGLGGPPWDQKRICLGNFWRGQFDVEGFDATANYGPPSTK